MLFCRGNIGNCAVMLPLLTSTMIMTSGRTKAVTIMAIMTVCYGTGHWTDKMISTVTGRRSRYFCSTKINICAFHNVPASIDRPIKLFKTVWKRYFGRDLPLLIPFRFYPISDDEISMVLWSKGTFDDSFRGKILNYS